MAGIAKRDPIVDLDAQIVETTDRARQGVTGNGVRYVLIFGLLGVIIAFVLVFTILGS
jgi:hypothetical protein